MQSPIQTLPDDALSEIFSIYTHELDEDPIKLTHVCRLWREMVRNTGTLWTDINLLAPRRARYNLERSGTSPLSITWFNHNYTPGVLRSADEFAWVWPHANRFSRIILAHSKHIVDSIFQALPQLLPQLVELVVLCQVVPSPIVPTATRIGQSMPYLKELQISYLTLHGEDVLRILRESGRLEKVELIYTPLVLPDNQLHQDEESINLSCLQAFNLHNVELLAQRYLMKSLIFPSRCTVTAIRDSTNFETTPVLHPDILDHFRPLHFTEIEIQPRILDLTEENTNGRASLRLIISTPGHAIDYNSLNSALGLSGVRVLTISSQPRILDVLLPHLSSVVKLVVKGLRNAQFVLPRISSQITSQSRADQNFLRSLKTLYLEGSNYDTSADANADCVERFLQDCRDAGRRIQTLRLRKCRFGADEAVLAKLSEYVEEIEIETA